MGTFRGWVTRAVNRISMPADGTQDGRNTQTDSGTCIWDPPIRTVGKTVQNSQLAAEIQFLFEEYIKSTGSHSVHNWLGHQRLISVLDPVNAKQDATTIHEDSAAYKITTSSLTLERPKSNNGKDYERRNGTHMDLISRAASMPSWTELNWTFDGLSFFLIASKPSLTVLMSLSFTLKTTTTFEVQSQTYVSMNMC